MRPLLFMLTGESPQRALRRIHRAIAVAVASCATALGWTTTAVGQSAVGHNVDAVIRYRVLVAVSIDDQTFTGEAIQELGLYENPVHGLVPSRVNLYLRGEALVMSLGGDRKLLIPMGGSSGYRYASLLPLSCDVSWDEHRSADDFAAAVKALDRPCRVPQEAMPFVVYVHNAATMEGARGAWPADYEEVLGSNTTIVSVSVEATDEPLTSGQIASIEWAAGLIGGETNHVLVPGTVLTRADFIRPAFQ